LLEDKADCPLFVMNGDVLTNVNFRELLSFHETGKAMATACVREHRQQVPFGVMDVQGDTLRAIEEKPMTSYLVNAGVYVLSPACLAAVPPGAAMDMPDLLRTILKAGHRVQAFPLRDYWRDVGRQDDLSRAEDEYDRHFPQDE